MSYELDERIAERLGIPPRPSASKNDGSAETLRHFDVAFGFGEARARWTNDQTRAFVAFAQAVHETRLDWYFAKIPPCELRYGRKQPGRDAQGVLGMVDGSPPHIRLSHSALTTNGEGSISIDDALVTWATEQRDLLSSGSATNWDVGLWRDQYDAEQRNPRADRNIRTTAT